MNEMTIKFNNQDYIAKYNSQTGYYELELEAPQTGGIYNANIKFKDLFEQEYEENQIIQVLAKESIKVETNKVFMWIFDYFTFKPKDIVELSNYEINIDEKTNAKSIITVLKKTTAKARDIVFIKRNNEIIYWGTIEEIQNEDGKKQYEYTIKYITNLFNQKIELSPKVQNVSDGFYYNIGFSLANKMLIDVENGSSDSKANVAIYERNLSDSKKWSFVKVSDNVYYIKNLKSGLYLTAENVEDNANVYQEKLASTTSDKRLQQWELKKEDSYVRIMNTESKKYLTVSTGSTNNGTNIKMFSYLTSFTERQKFILNQLDELMIRNDSIENFIAKKIKDNITNNEDTFINKKYLEIRVKSSTKLQVSVSNVDNDIFNLHTYMTSCTQNYNIVYSFYIENSKLIIEIENKEFEKELIDVKAQSISNYNEVFETDIVSKVVVLTQKGNYYLYLLNDRTTTTNMNNVNRADGKTETIYTEKYEDARQEALNIMKSNSYNHNITFDLYDKYIKVGTPITIKTKESIIYNSYISAVKITQKKFYEYICGNIRIKFIDKLLKERRN